MCMESLFKIVRNEVHRRCFRYAPGWPDPRRSLKKILAEHTRSSGRETPIAATGNASQPLRTCEPVRLLDDSS